MESMIHRIIEIDRNAYDAVICSDQKIKEHEIKMKKELDEAKKKILSEASLKADKILQDSIIEIEHHTDYIKDFMNERCNQLEDRFKKGKDFLKQEVLLQIIKETK